jgi:hypothetical protein
MLRERLSRNPDKHPNLTWRLFWGPLEVIKGNRDASLKTAKAMIVNGDIAEKFLAITLLGDLCNPVEEGEEVEADRIVRILARVARSESNPALLEATGYALGKPYRMSAMPAIYDLTFHEESNVRYSAAQAFSSALDVDGENLEPKYLDRMIELTDDKDPDIRDIATFQLGQQLPFFAIDTPEIKNVLIRRSHDRHTFTKTEAYLGLAERGDKSQIQNFQTWLEARLKRSWSGDLVRNCEAAGYYAVPELRSYVLRAEKLSQGAGAYDGEKEVYEWALKRCDPDPLIRAKTSKAMGLHLEEFDWNLDQNGVSVVYSTGAQIIDLHNECELVEMYTNYRELVLVFQVTHIFAEPSYFEIGDKLAMVIAGAEVPELPKVQYPANFEGIYDLQQGSCTLSIEDKVYPIKGTDLSIQFIPSQ